MRPDSLTHVLETVRAYYAEHAEARRGPTYAQIACTTGLHISTVRRALKELAVMRKIQYNPSKRRSIRLASSGSANSTTGPE